MSMTAGKSTSLFCCYFSICVCAYPHLSMWSFYIEFEADNHKMVYTYDTRDRDKPYKDSAQLKSRGDDLWLRNFPSTLDVFFFAPSAVADLGARDLLVRVTRN